MLIFSSIPVELEQAAMVDGTSQLGAVTRITLPLAAPGVVTAVIFTFISAWNELLVALTLSGGGSDSSAPLTVTINNYIGQYSVDSGHLFAGSVIATLPVIVLFAFIEGKVVGGLTAGSIKQPAAGRRPGRLHPGRQGFASAQPPIGYGVEPGAAGDDAADDRARGGRTWSVVVRCCGRLRLFDLVDELLEMRDLVA